MMKAVGIRELKSKLSQYLEEVKRGEVILVTDRGRVVAEIREPLDETRGLDSFERALWPLVKQGRVRLGGLADLDEIYAPTGVACPDEVVQRLLDASREESE